MMPELHGLLDLAWRQFWQVTVVAAVACALMRWACRGRPHLAYLLGLVVLAKCWTPPIWSSYGGVFCWPPALSMAAPHVERGGEPRRDKSSVTAAVAEEPQREAEQESPALSSASLAEPPMEPARGSFTVAAVFVAWLVGAIGFLATACAQWWRWRQGLRPVMAPNVPMELVVKEVAARVGLRSVPGVFVTQSSGPAVFGLLHPTIVIPERLMADRPGNLEMVLAHEMLHLRRGDLYVGLFQFATQLAWWFHPLVWWTCRQLTRERERSCDEAVLAVLRCEPPAYAQCLLDVLRWKRQMSALIPFPAIRALDVTQRRLEHILRRDGAPRSHTPLLYLILAAAALCFVLPGEQVVVVVSQAAPPDGAPRDTTPAPFAETRPSTGGTATEDEDNKAPSKDTVADDDNPPQPAADKSSQGLKIDEAVDRGIRYLKVEQRADGSWPDPVGYPGGITSLCTLTLLKWGMKPDERTAQTALAYLRPTKPSMTYSVAVHSMRRNWRCVI
ncbi:MAG: M56 family metallopeptidase [Pirellulales bacterium]